MSGRNQDQQPADFDSAACPILSRHFFGVGPLRPIGQILPAPSFTRDPISKKSDEMKKFFYGSIFLIRVAGPTFGVCPPMTPAMP